MHAAFRVPVQSITVLFFAGSALLLFFVLLAGIKSDGNVLNKWYWLAADTSGISNSPYAVSRWSMYGICGYEQGSDVKHPGAFINCTHHRGDYPFDLHRNFDVPLSELPADLRSDRFYYMTRFQYPFYLIAITFDVVALFASVAAGSSAIAGLITSVSSFLTFLFVTIAASLSTAAYVQARDALNRNDIAASIEPTLYGFVWAVVFMSIVTTVFSCLITPTSDTQPIKYKPNPLLTKDGGFQFRVKKNKSPAVVEEKKEASSFVRA